MPALTLLAAVALLAWLGIALRPGRFWDLRPVAGLLLVFGAPPAALLVGAAAREPLPAALGAAAWAVMAAIYLPTVRLFRLSPAWALALPAAGLPYGGMTVDSAIRHAAGARRAW